jgi:uncharacterized membrane protein
MSWFRALPLLWRLISILGLVAALCGAVGGVYAYVRHQGYVDGYADAAAKCAADKRAMEEANRKAISDAEQKLDAARKQLELKDAQLDDYLKALDLAADQDADAARVCLNDDSVRRLDAIQ